MKRSRGLRVGSRGDHLGADIHLDQGHHIDEIDINEFEVEKPEQGEGDNDHIDEIDNETYADESQIEQPEERLRDEGTDDEFVEKDIDLLGAPAPRHLSGRRPAIRVEDERLREDWREIAGRARARRDRGRPPHLLEPEHEAEGR